MKWYKIFRLSMEIAAKELQNTCTALNSVKQVAKKRQTG